MGSERITIEHVKRVIAETRNELNRLNAELRAKAARRNMMLAEIFRIRKREHHLRGEIMRFDAEAHRMNMKILEKKRILNEAKKLGLV